MSEQRQAGIVRRQADAVRVGADSPPATGTDTVTVACKVPNGLHMILYDTEEEYLSDLAGNRVKSFRSFPRPDVAPYILNGCSVDIEKMRKGVLDDRHQGIVQGDLPGTGFGLTPGIPREYWEEWSTTVGKSFIKSGMVFAAKNDREARAEAHDKRNLRSGLEPLDPSEPGPRAGLVKGTITATTVAASRSPNV